MAIAVISSVASSASSQQLLAYNDYRKGVIIVNTDTNNLFIKFGTTATTGAGGFTYKLTSGATFEMAVVEGQIYRGRIDGIWDAAGAGVAEITELS